MEERMMILKMLQEGKITAEEANKLIEAIDRGSQKHDFPKFDAAKFEEKMNKIGEKAGKTAEKLSEKFGESFSSNADKFQNNADRFAEDFSKKMEGFGNDMAEAAVKFADKLVNFLNNTFDIGNDKYQFNQTYTYTAAEAANINVSGTNFAVNVSPSENEDITVNLYVNSNIPQLNIDEFFRADINDNNFNFITEFSGRTWGKIELLVPKSINSLTINTTNGKCELNEISSDLIKSHTSNGKIIVSECNSRELEAITNNGKVVCEDSTINSANISTSNGKIEISDSKIDNIEAKTSNGSIQLSGITKPEAVEGRYNLRTSNGKIALTLDECDSCGFTVDANTSLGGINIDLPELAYVVNKKTSTMSSTAMIRSTNYDKVDNKVYIKATTSNASITIEGK